MGNGNLTTLQKHFQDGSIRRLADIQTSLLELAQGFQDARFKDLLRELHTLKGESRVVGLQQTASLIHEIEGWLSDIEETLEPEIEHRCQNALRLIAKVCTEMDEAPFLNRLKNAQALHPIHEASDSDQNEEAKENPDAKVLQQQRWVQIRRERFGSFAERLQSICANHTTQQKRFVSWLTGARRLQEEAEIRGDPVMVRQCNNLIRRTTHLMEQHLDIGFDLEFLAQEAQRFQHYSVALLLQQHQQSTRALGFELNKNVSVTIECGDVMVDTEIWHLLDAVLLHLTRNAIDHGIEASEQRKQKGKEPTGRIILRAQAENHRVQLEVEDDGKGLAVDEIRARAQAEGMSGGENDDFLEMIFSPGFSTRQIPTLVSGRGIGLDIVRDLISAAGGTVQVVSELGKGARFVIDLPAQTTRVQCLVASVGYFRFAIPATNVRVTSKGAWNQVEAFGDELSVQYESDWWPVIELHRIFGIGRAQHQGQFIFLEGKNRRAALYVDDIEGHIEPILQHQPEEWLSDLDLLGGTSIDSNGFAVCILNTEVLLSYSSAYRGTVVLAEDSDVFRASVGEGLRRDGWKVEAFNDGLGVLRYVQTTDAQPNLVITDIDMPEFDGVALTRRLREQRYRGPILVYSARADDLSRKQALEAGASFFIVKTHSPHHNLRSMVRVAQQKRVI